MIKIDFLKYHQDTIPQLAQIWHIVLGRTWPLEVSIERVSQLFESHMNDNKLPLTLIALYDGKVIGMCSLRENDGIRPDLKPWLGSLMVAPLYQNQGVGQLLINAIKQKAKQFAFKKLYLFTYDPQTPAYYEKIGWQQMGIDHCKGRPVTVMKITL